MVLIPTDNILSKVDLYLWMVRTDSADQIGKKKWTAICDPFCSRISTGFKLIFSKAPTITPYHTMPVGKSRPKKNKGGNKKKKGAPKGKARTNANNAASSSSSSSLPLLKGTVPNFGRRPTSIHDNHRTLYSRYKSATARFIKYMQTHTPDDIKENDRSINWLSTAAEWMEESQHTLDPIVLKDLKLCICIRSRVAKSSFGGGDAGHKVCYGLLCCADSSLPHSPLKIAVFLGDVDLLLLKVEAFTQIHGW